MIPAQQERIIPRRPHENPVFAGDLSQAVVRPCEELDRSFVIHFENQIRLAQFIRRRLGKIHSHVAERMIHRTIQARPRAPVHPGDLGLDLLGVHHAALQLLGSRQEFVSHILRFVGIVVPRVPPGLVLVHPAEIVLLRRGQLILRLAAHIRLCQNHRLPHPAFHNRNDHPVTEQRLLGNVNVCHWAIVPAIMVLNDFDHVLEILVGCGFSQELLERHPEPFRIRGHQAIGDHDTGL